MKQFRDYISANSDLRLSTQEKGRMRDALHAAMDYNPRRAPLPKKTYSLLSFRIVSVSVLSLLLVFSGTAFASAGSLPGDILYPVKRYVTEPLSSVAAITPSQKAAWHTHIAQTRAQEAEQLASESKLQPAVAQDLQNNIVEHTSNASQLIAEVSSKNEVEGDTLAINLDASLSAHAHVLEQISSHQKDEVTAENSRKLARALSRDESPDLVTPAASASMATLAAEPAPTVSSSSPQPPARVGKIRNKKNLDALRKSAVDDLTQTESIADTQATSSDTSVGDSITTIKALISIAEASTTEPDEAEKHYKKALRESVKLRTLLRAHEEFKGVPVLPAQASTFQNEAQQGSSSKIDD